MYTVVRVLLLMALFFGALGASFGFLGNRLGWVEPMPWPYDFETVVVVNLVAILVWIVGLGDEIAKS